MKAIDFITTGLERIAKIFPLVEIRYGFNYDINTHIVQFDPLDAYYNLPELDAMWIPFAMEFDEKFMDESVAFIGSDSILAVTHCFTGSWNIQPVDVFLEGFNQIISKSDLMYSRQSLPENIIWKQDELEHSSIALNNGIVNYSSAQEDIYFPGQATFVEGNSQIEGTEPQFEDFGKLAMAA